MKYKRSLSLFMILVFIFSLCFPKGFTVSAATGSWISTTDSVKPDANLYTKITNPIYSNEEVQAWHYPGGYWGITANGGSGTKVYDSDAAKLLKNYPVNDVIVQVPIPSNVITAMNKNGVDSIRALISAVHTETLQNTNYSYRIDGTYLDIKFDAKLLNEGVDFWGGRDNTFPLPEPNPAYGENAFSVFDINSSTQFGAVYTNTYQTTPITAGGISISANGWGLFYHKDIKYGYVNMSGDYAGTKYGSQMRISLGALHNGGAQAAIYYFPFAVTYYAHLPANVQLKYVDEDTGSSIQANTVKNDEDYGNNTYTAQQTISANGNTYKLDTDFKTTTTTSGSETDISTGQSSQSVTVQAGNTYVITFKYQKQPTTGKVTVKYIDQDTNNDLATADNFTEQPGSHTYEAKDINGYALQGTDTQTITVVAGKAYTVTFKYKAIPTTGKVTLRYVDQSTNADIATPSTLTEQPGSHTYTAKTIVGYTLQGASTQTITVVAGNTYTVIFKYSKDPTTANVTIRYIDQSNNNDIIPADNLTSEKAGTHTYNAKSITGYTLQGASSQTITVVAGKSYTITFKYSKNPTTATVTIRYIDQATNNDLLPADNLTSEAPGSHTYNSKTIQGYTLQGASSQTITLVAGKSYTVTFKYNAEVKQPPTVTLTAPRTKHQGETFTVSASGHDPKGESLTYYWSVSDGQTLTGQSGSLVMGAAPIVVSVYVQNTDGLQSSLATATISPANGAPTTSISVPPTVSLGDNLYISSTASDPDGDVLNVTWNTLADMNGSLGVNGGAVYFDNVNDIGQTFTFTITATDPFGLTSTSTGQTTVVAPTPTAKIVTSGTLKENRKVTIDSSSSLSGSSRFPINKTVWKVTVSGGAATDIKTLDSYSSTAMNFVFKKAGTYSVFLTVTNAAGYSHTATTTITIAPDLAPIASIYLDSPTGVRDPSVLSPHGLAECHSTVIDNSYSNDSDIISKKIYFACFDSDNDKSFIYITNNEDGTKKKTPEYERWYVYDQSYAGDSDTQQVVQVPDSTPVSKFVYVGADGKKYAYVNDALNPHWKYIGNYYDVMNFDINSIPSCTEDSVKFYGTSVGEYEYYNMVQESFGQPTIPALVTPADYKTANSFD